MNNLTLLAIIEKMLGDKISELSSETSPIRGPRGFRGAPGEPFNFSEHEETIKNWVKELSLKFEDLTEEQKDSLKGDTGLSGSDGKDFNFEENKELIEEMVSSLIENKKEDLKLKFSDLSDDEVDQLKGRNGRDGRPGRDGKDFEFSDHQENIQEIIASSLEEMEDQLKLKFSDLTNDELNSLKLKFTDLSPDEIKELKGPRGQRGRQGAQGEIGEQGEKGETGPQGLQGPIGPRGIQGIPGVVGRTGLQGLDGRDGRNAPYIIDIEIETFLKEIRFKFSLSDGSIFYTDWVELPQQKSGAMIFGGGVTGTPPIGPSGSSILEKKSVSLVSNVWLTVVPDVVTSIHDVEIYDDTLLERVELDIKFNSAMTEFYLRSKKSLTFTAFIEGV